MYTIVIKNYIAMQITITGAPHGVQGPTFPVTWLRNIKVKAKIVKGKAIVKVDEMVKALKAKNLQDVADYWKEYKLPTINFVGDSYTLTV
jgi:hypothetical protein